MKLIGLTGNSGSGKTFVCSVLKKYGVYVINCDLTARNVVKKDLPAYNEIVNYFGHEILNSQNEINRKLLGEIIYSDKQMQKKLNEITHYYITKELLAEIKNCQHELVCVDAPLLFESGFDEYCNEIWVVEAPLSVKINRIIERDGLSYEVAQKRINSQMKFEDMKLKADKILFNDGDFNSLEKAIIKLISD